MPRLPQFLQDILATRGVEQDCIEPSLATLLPPEMKGMDECIDILSNAQHKHILIASDYDADGATATAVMVKGLKALGFEKVSFAASNRFAYGYGLSEQLVEDIMRLHQPDIILTVDNGISSNKGVQRARELGAQVIITDHHIPPDVLPEADAIVNPNQKGCCFASKAIAGCGVAFYVIIALRRALGSKQPLGFLLDLVALGTIADVVALDKNNRILVHNGLQRIRKGHGCFGIEALFIIAKRNIARASSESIGFYIAPLINASGRLEDIETGIKCLLEDNSAQAQVAAGLLYQTNIKRRELTQQMQQQAENAIANCGDIKDFGNCICLFNEQWHKGIVGIVAGRLKSLHHKVVFCFAKADDGLLVGSGRSVSGVHLRDVLALVAQQGYLKSFGGHAMAAGVSIAEKDFERFYEDIQQILVHEQLVMPKAQIDAILRSDQASDETALLIESLVWGQGCPPPLFASEFYVESVRVIKGGHLRIELAFSDGKLINSVYFSPKYQAQELEGVDIFAHYRLKVGLKGKAELLLEEVLL